MCTSQFDKDKPHHGLLKGLILVRVFRCIFTGPSTAMQKDARNPSKSQAEIHNIISVEPFGIVYAAVLALLSTAWCLKDLHFDYKVFTEQLLSLFKDCDNPWMKKLLSWWNRQVCFRKVKNSTFDDIDDSGDDENVVSVNDLLTQAAKDPDSDGNTSGVDEDLGSPLSAGSALAPANTTYHNTLLCIFHDTAQAAQDRLSAQEDEPDDRLVDQPDPPLSPPSLPLLAPMSATSSQTTSSARINLNGKRPYSQPLAHDKENLQPPLPPVPVPNKKARAGGRTMAGRGGHHKE